MATTIVLKNSVTTTNAPSSLTQGEVAVNVTDKKVWVGNAATTPIQLLGSGADGVFSSVTDTGLTSTRVTYAGTGGLLKDSASITTDGTSVTAGGFIGPVGASSPNTGAFTTLSASTVVSFPSWTTATRPGSPAVGQMGYNTTIGKFDQYTAAGWTSIATQSGKVLQVVQGTSSTTVTTSSTTFVTTGLSASITPSSATSKVLALVSAPLDSGGAGQQIFFSLYRGATNLGTAGTGFGAVYDSGGRVMTQAVVSYLDSPATTSSTTYALYFLTNTGTVAYSNNGSLGTIQLLEISA